MLRIPQLKSTCPLKHFMILTIRVCKHLSQYDTPLDNCPCFPPNKPIPRISFVIYSEATILAITSDSANVMLKFVIVFEGVAEPEEAAIASPLTVIPPPAFELIFAPD